MGSLAEIFAMTPIICKLADLVENSSNVVQTATFCNQSIVNVYRGLPVYMAPRY